MAELANIAENIVHEELKEAANEKRRSTLLSIRKKVPGSRNSAGGDLNPPEGVLVRSSVVRIPPGMSVIEQTQHVFLRDGGTDFIWTFYDLPNRYELLDTDGVRLLFAAETYQELEHGNDCIGAGSIRFDVSILALQGGGVLRVKGEKTGRATISNFHKTIGTVIDVSGFWRKSAHRAYEVRDADGNEAFKIRKVKHQAQTHTSADGTQSQAHGRETEYEILNEELTKIGYMKEKWKSDDEPLHAPIDNILFGVCLPQDMDTNEKILLVGALFAVFFQHRHDQVYASLRSRCCVVLAYIVIASILIGLMLGFLLWLKFG